MKKVLNTNYICCIILIAILLPGCGYNPAIDDRIYVPPVVEDCNDSYVCEANDLMPSRGRYTPRRPVSTNTNTFTQPYEVMTFSSNNDIYSNLNADLNDSTVNDQIYTVVKGDTLIGLSRKFGITRQELALKNQLLADSTLKIGQKLKVPASARGVNTVGTSHSEDIMGQHVRESEYIVESGDSLSAIAKRFDTTVKAIKQLNSLNNDIIRVGQKLRVPSGSASSELVAGNKGDHQSGSSNLYKVQAGDNIAKIAAKYHMKSADLIRLNNLSNPDSLKVGQMIVLSEAGKNELNQHSMSVSNVGVQLASDTSDKFEHTVTAAGNKQSTSSVIDPFEDLFDTTDILNSSSNEDSDVSSQMDEEDSLDDSLLDEDDIFEEDDSSLSVVPLAS